MAHILDGDWSSFIRTNGGNMDEDEAGLIHLEIDPGTGKLKSGSNQNGHPLRGDVTREGRFHIVQIANDDDNHTYEGVLSVDHSPGAGRQRVLSGRIRLNFVPPRDELRDEASSEAERFDQEQAIWVATKP